jgi:hypothetical protein
VDIIADTDKKSIKCENCAKIHEKPNDGFSGNLALQELIEFERKEVSHSKHIEEFKKLLDTLYATKQSIESTLEGGDATIRDHCDKVRINCDQIRTNQRKMCNEMEKRCLIASVICKKVKQMIIYS